MWLRAGTAKKKFNQTAQTQDAYGTQAMSLLYLVEGFRRSSSCW